jgi:hypothetical protein
MSLNAGVMKLRAEVGKLMEAMGEGGREPLVVYRVNDPQRAAAGPDECEINGVAYLRGENEERAAFEARFMPAAIAAGLRVVCVSVEDYGPGPFLDDFRREPWDPTKTIEIGGPSLPGEVSF